MFGAQVGKTSRLLPDIWYLSNDPPEILVFLKLYSINSRLMWLFALCFGVRDLNV